ncbi:unnamed protein product [Cuscuta campestris]|uniref:Cysteine-rich receptor-like protein kinase 10 n=1 Tax=Cuscuta campestris TaxID=132261 RepID=A0A484K0M7_9ASTE|nr:unnamed protein product [Cuscuta campestris]
MLGYQLFFLFSSSAFFLLATAGISDQQPVAFWCNNTEFYASNSTFRSNLDSLLSDLTSNATRPDGFYNSTSGDGNDTAYGLFMCRGDLSPEACAACVRKAGAYILLPCPNYKTAFTWYDECMLRYSWRPMFGELNDNFPSIVLYSQYDPTTDNLMDQVGTALGKVANRTTGDDGSGKRYATEEARVGGGVNGTIYCAGQCTPDIPDTDCEDCMTNAIQLLVSEKGNRVLFPSCNVRYEVYSFYNRAAAASPPPPPPIALPPSLDSTIPPSPTPGNKDHSSSSKDIIVIVLPICGFIIIIAILCLVRIKHGKGRIAKHQKTDVTGLLNEEFYQYNLATIQDITKGFSSESKIGEGGYGFVYKGKLPDGQEVAIKRLSKCSDQGVQEFKNEVEVVAKLQHRNLVRLLGYCSEGEERILVYEFVPNKSLDYFLFDPENQYLLDWSRRYKIIGGIVRGMLYLHQDSRLRIIHRDLKASNILLDANMNAKIADFGTAKISSLDQTQQNTSRIVGTYGYMSPEYALYGEYSVKSDIFSFGVLLLEIVSGRKNRRFLLTKEAQHLLSYAWDQWKDGTPLEILDPVLEESHNIEEVIQCIHIGLLCVQDIAENRPTMGEVMLMLTSYSIRSWPSPSKPAFYRCGGSGGVSRDYLGHENSSLTTHSSSYFINTPSPAMEI